MKRHKSLLPQKCENSMNSEGCVSSVKSLKHGTTSIFDGIFKIINWYWAMVICEGNLPYHLVPRIWCSSINVNVSFSLHVVYCFKKKHLFSCGLLGKLELRISWVITPSPPLQTKSIKWYWTGSLIFSIFQSFCFRICQLSRTGAQAGLGLLWPYFASSRSLPQLPALPLCVTDLRTTWQHTIVKWNKSWKLFCVNSFLQPP